MVTSGSAYDDIMKIPAYAADIRASSKGVKVEQEALDLAKHDPIRLDTQIRSSILQLSVAWKSAAKVLKVAAADRAEYEAEIASLAEQLKERTTLCEQLQKEKKDQIEKEAAATKKEVEDEAKKAVDIVVASRNKLIQAFYFWGLSREDVDLALAGKYIEIIFQGDDASPVAEQSLAPLVADDTTKEVHNKLEYVRLLHKSNFDNTFTELFELQCRYGKIKIERDEVLRKESDRFILLQKSLKDKRFVDESDKLECQRSLLSLTLYFVAEVDSERGLKEAYLELLIERGIVPDPARVKFLAQEAHVDVEIDKVGNMWFAKGNEGGGASTLKSRVEVSEEEEVEDLLPYTRHKTHPQEDKQALILGCMQGNEVYEELHVKYKELQSLVDAADDEIQYSKKVDKKLQRLKREMERKYDSILATSTEYCIEYDLQLARLSYIDNLMPRVMELLNASSSIVDAAIPFPALLSSGPGESSNVVRPKRENFMRFEVRFLHRSSRDLVLGDGIEWE
ncbi:hypothetical protein GIB67_007471 [Kingdonia uniflora]|uniref:Uncharacterized protein n=1 Tax=Kingdonia uniflora TaxID=39325 RepID=A0A7J7MMI3_9MAGN|nr:hypothetical protein GIB67_007471 [Kingdonia uniflora]